MPPASFNVDSRHAEKPPRMSNLLVLLGSISIFTPFPSICTCGRCRASLPACTPAFSGSIADHLGRRPPLRCGLAHIVGGFGPERIFRRAMMATAAVGLAPFGASAVLGVALYRYMH
jgi:hypothetical protein